jgi:hypothetical protein
MDLDSEIVRSKNNGPCRACLAASMARHCRYADKSRGAQAQVRLRVLARTTVLAMAVMKSE